VRVLLFALLAGSVAAAVGGCQDSAMPAASDGGCGVDCFPSMRCEQGRVLSWAMATGVACNERCKALMVYECDAGCVKEGCSISGFSAAHGADPVRLCRESPPATPGNSCWNDLECLAPVVEGPGDGGTYLICADGGCASFAPSPGQFPVPRYMAGCQF
jgi:hypothetical protein